MRANQNRLSTDFCLMFSLSRNFSAITDRVPMLRHYAFSNFQSFRDQTVVSFELSQKAASHGWQVTSRGNARLTTVLAVMGANGAGKTGALKPLAFVAWFVAHSFHLPADQPIPMSTHALATAEPARIALEVEDTDGCLWRYELEIRAQRVFREALFRKRERFNYVFVRTLNADESGYDIKQQGFDFSPAEARKVRFNASLISTAAQYGVPLAQWLRSFGVVTNINLDGRSHFGAQHLAQSAEFFAQDDGARQRMVGFLASWDLGVSEVDIERLDAQRADGSVDRSWHAKVKHHSALGEFALRMEQESSGTQSAFVLLSRLLPVLRDGGLAVLDELDSDLHPLMIEPILDLFANPATNPHQAQLIFTCHTSEILDLLHKSQVLLVEKTDGHSQGYRADEIKGLRSDDNLRAKYMAGALGGIPRF
ncbi:AAA family ATPase [Roseateles amylovorans]|uniref:ATP-binding protein n=1 Tax=Roseateles amylovorans TaxID=2978473 RepID=A0ABY6AZ80_9BURK|nr:ATP-binding protein [Roseateles amylovorans]UXH76608.1 ATP-binding protein [Roseateles amylovorans]